MFYRRARAMHHCFNHWLVAGIGLLGCSGRAQSSCEAADQCASSGGQSPAVAGSHGDEVLTGVGGSHSGGAGKNGTAGAGRGAAVDPRSDSQSATIAGRANGGGSNSPGNETVAGGTSSSGGASAIGGSSETGGSATTGWCATPYCVFGTDAADGGLAVAVDKSGYIYIAGSTNGALAGANAGAADAFVRKLDASGAVVWTRQFGTSSDDYATSIAVDGDGNVYVAGDTLGALAGSNAGSQDSYLRKLDKSGATLWTRQFGTQGPEQLGTVALDSSGHAYVSGSTYPTGNQSSGDPYVRKFDASGGTVWAKQFGGADEDEAEAVAVDATGNVYVVGWTYDLIPESKVGSWDAFVRKLDASGNPLWTRVFGTSDPDVIEVAAVDGEGNLYVAGSTGNALAGASFGSQDAFVRKYDPAGATLWTRQIGTSGWDYGIALGVDGDNNVSVVGSTDGAFSGSNAGKQDVFIRKLDKSGSTLWTKQFGTSSSEAAYGATADASGAVYVVGYTGELEQADGFLLRVPAQAP